MQELKTDLLFWGDWGFWKAVFVEFQKNKTDGQEWCEQFTVQVQAIILNHDTKPKVPSGSNAVETKLMCLYICIYNRHWRRPYTDMRSIGIKGDYYIILLHIKKIRLRFKQWHYSASKSSPNQSSISLTKCILISNALYNDNDLTMMHLRGFDNFSPNPISHDSFRNLKLSWATCINHFHHERTAALSPFIYYTQSKNTRRIKVKQPSATF